MTTAAVVLVLLALSLLIVAVRGRRTNDHPLCRRCGYDLTGRAADAGRCGECGADLSRPAAVRVGHRRRRSGLLATSILLLVVSVTGGGLLVWARAAKFDPEPHKPVWWLRLDAAGSTAARSAAVGEVARRADHLSAEQLAPFVARALDLQASAATWDVAGCRLIEAAHAAGKLAPAAWATYAKQAYTVGLYTRPTIVAGDPLPISFPMNGVRLNDAGFMVSGQLVAVSIDSRPVPLPAGGDLLNEGMLETFATTGNTGTSLDGPTIDGHATADLRPGQHTISATVRLDVSEADPQWQGAVLVGTGFVAYHPQGAVEQSASAAFTVTPLASVRSDDDALRPAVESGLSVKPIDVEPDGRSADFELDWHHPPVRLAFDMSLRLADGRELPVGLLQVDAMPGTMTYSKAGLDVSGLGSATRVDVVFRPDAAAARRTLDPTPIWGGTIVVRDVRVTPVMAR